MSASQNYNLGTGGAVNFNVAGTTAYLYQNVAGVYLNVTSTGSSPITITAPTMYLADNGGITNTQTSGDAIIFNDNGAGFTLYSAQTTSATLSTGGGNIRFTPTSGQNFTVSYWWAGGTGINVTGAPVIATVNNASFILTSTVFTSNNTITLNVNNGTLNIGSSGIIRSSATGNTITVQSTSNLSVIGNGSFSQTNATPGTSRLLSTSGTLTYGATYSVLNNSPFTISTQALSFSGAATLTASGSSNITINNGGLASPFTITGSGNGNSVNFYTTGGTINIAPTSGQNLIFATPVGTSGIYFNGTANVSVDNANLTVNSNVTLGSSSGTTSAITLNVNNGTLTNNGILYCNATSGNAINLASTGSLTVAGTGTWQTQTAASSNWTATSGSITLAAGALQSVANSAPMNITTSNFILGNGSTLQGTGATVFTISGGSGSLSVTLPGSGGSATITSAGAAAVFTAAAGQSITFASPTGSSTLNVNNTSFSGAQATINAGASTTVNINANVTLFSNYAWTVNLNGATFNNNGALSTSNSGNSITFQSTGALTLAGSGTISQTHATTPGTTRFISTTTAGSSINIANSAYINITGGGAITVSTPNVNLGSFSTFAAAGATSVLTLDTGATANNLTITGPGSSSAVIFTNGGAINITPTLGYSTTFAAASGQTAINFVSGPVTVTTGNQGANNGLTTINSGVQLLNSNIITFNVGGLTFTNNGTIESTASGNSINMLSTTAMTIAGTGTFIQDGVTPGTTRFAPGAGYNLIFSTNTNQTFNGGNILLSAYNIDLNNGTTLSSTGASTYTISSASNLNMTVQGNGSTASIASNGGAINISSAGTINFNMSTGSGSLNLNPGSAGTLSINSGSSVLTIGNGMSLNSDGNINVQTISNYININGSLNSSKTGATVNFTSGTGALYFNGTSGAVNLANGGTINLTSGSNQITYLYGSLNFNVGTGGAVNFSNPGTTGYLYLVNAGVQINVTSSGNSPLTITAPTVYMSDSSVISNTQTSGDAIIFQNNTGANFTFYAPSSLNSTVSTGGGNIKFDISSGRSLTFALQWAANTVNFNGGALITTTTNAGTTINGSFTLASNNTITMNVNNSTWTNWGAVNSNPTGTPGTVTVQSTSALTIDGTGTINVARNGNSHGGTINILATNGAITVNSAPTWSANAGASGGNGGNINIQAVSLSLPGGQLTLNADAVSNGSGGFINIQATGSTSNLNIAPGAIVVSAVGLGSTGNGGRLTLEAGRHITLNAAQMNLSTTATNGNGGELMITAGTANTGNLTFNGTAATFSVNGNGTGNGGIVSLSATGTLTVNTTNTFTANAVSGSGNGGQISITAPSNIPTPLTLQASAAGGAGTGNGGTISVTATGATGDITIGAGALVITATGGGSGGDGGQVLISAGRNLTLNAGSINVNALGGNGKGGQLTTIAGTATAGNLNFTGPGTFSVSGSGTGDGGTININVANSAGSLSLTGTTTFSANAGSSGGNGGNIIINAPSLPSVGSTLTFNADAAGTGNGGTISITTTGTTGDLVVGNGSGSLAINARGGSSGSASGNGGSISLIAARSLIVDPVYLNLSPRGNNGNGGIATLTAGNNAGASNPVFQVNGSVSTSGVGTGNGGTISISYRDASNSLTVGATSASNYINGNINADAPGSGNGGSITITNLATAALDIVLTGNITALSNSGTWGSLNFSKAGQTVSVVGAGSLAGAITSTGTSVTINPQAASTTIMAQSITSTSGNISLTANGTNSQLVVLSGGLISAVGGNVIASVYGALGNNGTITSSNDDGSVSITGTGGLYISGNGSITQTGSGNTSITISVSGANQLIFDGNQTLNAGASGTINFNAQSSSANLLFSASRTQTIQSGSSLYLSAPYIEFATGSGITATGASNIYVNNGLSASPIVVALANGSDITISTTGGSFNITPTAGQTATFFTLSSGSAALHLNGGPVTVNISNSATLQIQSGTTLSATGNIIANINNGSFDNSGTLATSGTIAFNIDSTGILNNGTIRSSATGNSIIFDGGSGQFDLAGIGAIDQTAGGTTVFTTVSGQQIRVADNTTQTIIGGGAVNITTSTLNYLGDGAINANGASVVSLTTPGSSDLSVIVADGSFAYLSTNGGTISVAPAAGGSITVSKTGAGADAFFNLDGGAVAITADDNISVLGNTLWVSDNNMTFNVNGGSDLIVQGLIGSDNTSINMTGGLINNTGFLQSTATNGNLNIISSSSLTITGSGTFWANGGGTSNILFQAGSGGANTLSFASGSHVIDPGSGGIVTMNAQNSGGSISLGTGTNLFFGANHTVNFNSPEFVFAGNGTWLHGNTSNLNFNPGTGNDLTITAPNNGAGFIATSSANSINFNTVAGHGLIFTKIAGPDGGGINIGGPSSATITTDTGITIDANVVLAMNMNTTFNINNGTFTNNGILTSNVSGGNFTFTSTGNLTVTGGSVGHNSGNNSSVIFEAGTSGASSLLFTGAVYTGGVNGTANITLRSLNGGSIDFGFGASVTLQNDASGTISTNNLNFNGDFSGISASGAAVLNINSGGSGALTIRTPGSGSALIQTGNTGTINIGPANGQTLTFASTGGATTLNLLGQTTTTTNGADTVIDSGVNIAGNNNLLFNVNNATLSNAGSISIQHSSTPATLTMQSSGNLLITGGGTYTSGIAGGGNGGNIVITAAAGTLDITGGASINANATGSGTNGGNISITGQTLGLSGGQLTLNADAANTGNGGTITITANGASGDVSVAAGTMTISALGGPTSGDGGSVSISAGRSVNINANAISADAQGSSGNGGGLSLIAGNQSAGSLSIDGNLSVNGSGSGNGGTLTIRQNHASGTLALTSVTAFNANGGTSGSGGSIELTTPGLPALGSLLTLNANGNGTANGGTIELTTTGATGDINIGTASGNIQLSAAGGSNGSASGNGGSAIVSAGGALNVSGANSINVSPRGNNGNGGSVDISASTASNSNISIASDFNTDGVGSGDGGVITITQSSANNNIVITGATISAYRGTTGATDGSVDISIAGTGSGMISLDNVTTVQGDSITFTTTNFTDNGTVTSTSENGTIFIQSNGALTINGNPNPITVTGNGYGAMVALTASGANALTVNPDITLDAGANGVVYLDASASGGSVVLAANADVVITSSPWIGVFAPNVTLNDSATVQATGSNQFIEVGSGTIDQVITLPSTGSTTISAANGGQVYIGPYDSSSLTFNSSGGAATTLNIDSDLLYIYSGTTTVNNNVSVVGNNNIWILGDGASSTVTINGNGQISSSGDGAQLTVSSASGDLIINGTNTSSAKFAVTGNGAWIDLSAPGVINITGSTIVDVGTAGQLNIAGSELSIANGVTLTSTGGIALPVFMVTLGDGSVLHSNVSSGSAIGNPAGLQAFTIRGVDGGTGTISTDGGSINLWSYGTMTFDKVSGTTALNFSGGTLNVASNNGETVIKSGVALNSNRDINFNVNTGTVESSGQLTTTSSGSISLTAATGLLSIGANAIFYADEGNIIIRNIDTAGGTIDIGSGANIHAYTLSNPTLGNVSIVIGPQNPAQIAGTMPANVTVDAQGGGQVYFGSNGITADGPTNTLNAWARNITFDSGSAPATSIRLGGNVTLTADPPLANTQIDLSINTASANNNVFSAVSTLFNSDTNRLSGAVTPVDTTGPIENLQNPTLPPLSASTNTEELCNQIGSINNSVITSNDENQQDDSGNTLEEISFVKPAAQESYKFFGKYTTKPSQGENTDRTQLHTIDMDGCIIHGKAKTRVSIKGGGIELKSGEIVLEATRPTAIKVNEHIVHMKGGAVALVSIHKGVTRISNLCENKAESIQVRVANSNRSIPLSAGQESLISHNADQLTDFVANDNLGHRRTKHIDTKTGHKILKSEVSLISAMQQHQLLSDIMASDNDSDNRLESRLVKMAACLMVVTNNHGLYAQGGPAHNDKGQ